MGQLTFGLILLVFLIVYLAFNSILLCIMLIGGISYIAFDYFRKKRLYNRNKEELK
jgi:hypothetical protein